MIYYTHPMSWYETTDEKEDLAKIAEQWPGEPIDNPAAYSGVPEAQAMEFFLDKVRSADKVVYRAFYDGSIGSGVAKEILEGIVYRKPIFRLFTVWARKGNVVTIETHRTPGVQFVLSREATHERVKRGVL